ncbi:unnamed protein product [Parnassius apollo]|uniref:(apollo) hypothetical protein n=1 Tax=Parnassius apollo TaxID=110799 RepID=A0A8S3WFP2_PARAO|nr:unnamed protein product [Parnassius apollo]
MNILIKVFVLLMLLRQAAFGQLTTIPLGVKCRCVDVPLTTNPHIPLTPTVGVQNNLIKQFASPLPFGNTLSGLGGLSLSNGLSVFTTPPIVNTATGLNGMQVTQAPTANNARFSIPSNVPTCPENILAGISITPLVNTEERSFGNSGRVLSTGNIANVGNLGLANIGLQFVPNSGIANMPVQLQTLYWAKRVCRQAVENWRLMKFPAKKPFFKKAPFKRRAFHRPLISKIEPVHLEVDEAISEFKSEEDSACVDTDGIFATQKNKKFKLFHKLHKIEEFREEIEYEEMETIYDDFEDSDELYDITDIYYMNANNIQNVYYCDTEDKN